MKVKLEFNPSDLWIGCYFKRHLKFISDVHYHTNLHVWITLVPMFPIHITIKLPG